MEKKYKVPIGPVHVGLKEPITAWLDLEGEKIVGATVRPGAIHRGIEFMARDRNPIQVIYLSERICGICSFAHVITFLRAVEDAASVPVPPRAQYIRSLVLELSAFTAYALGGWPVTPLDTIRPSTLGWSSGKGNGRSRGAFRQQGELRRRTVGGVRWDFLPNWPGP